MKEFGLKQHRDRDGKLASPFVHKMGPERKGEEEGHGLLLGFIVGEAAETQECQNPPRLASPHPETPYPGSGENPHLSDSDCSLTEERSRDSCLRHPSHTASPHASEQRGPQQEAVDKVISCSLRASDLTN